MAERCAVISCIAHPTLRMSRMQSFVRIVFRLSRNDVKLALEEEPGRGIPSRNDVKLVLVEAPLSDPMS